jgi:hypothetical protein
LKLTEYLEYAKFILSLPATKEVLMVKQKENTQPAVSFRFDEKLKADLLRLAKADSRKLSDYIRLVLARHVREEKERQRAQESQPAAA